MEVAYAGPRGTRNGCAFQKAAIGMMAGAILVQPIGMEPVIGALLGPMLLGEMLTLWQWAGTAGIAAAVLGTALTTRPT